MVRPLRIEYPGAYYHVMNRGLAYSDIFLDDNHRQRFLLLIGKRVKSALGSNGVKVEACEFDI